MTKRRKMYLFLPELGKKLITPGGVWSFIAVFC